MLSLKSCPKTRFAVPAFRLPGTADQTDLANGAQEDGQDPDHTDQGDRDRYKTGHVLGDPIEELFELRRNVDIRTLGIEPGTSSAAVPAASAAAAAGQNAKDPEHAVFPDDLPGAG
jgi:hypothetical protein